MASIIVVSTNELHHLESSLPSLHSLEDCNAEVLVVDNASSDGTAGALERDYPWVRVIRSDTRLGYAAANNLGFRHARGEYLIVLNPDTRVDPMFACTLVESSRANGDRSLITSLVCMFDSPETVNTCGNVVQFALLAGCRGLGSVHQRFSKEEEVASVSGCAFLIPRSVLDSMGGFDEATFLYLEDTELSMRAWLYGFTCRTCPSSRVFHKYQIRLTPQKFLFIERNRWIVMLRTYRVGTLVLLAPALLTIELFSWALAFRLGRNHLQSKARSLVGVARLLPTIWKSRQLTQKRRIMPDSALLAQQQGSLPVGQLLSDSALGHNVVRIANIGFAAYFGAVRAVVRW